MMRDSAGPVERLLRNAVASGLAPGAVAVWNVDGESPRSAAVGHARLRPHPVSAGPDTWFDLASLTKPLVVTTLCLLAIRRGELDLAAPLADVLPEARATETERVTIQHLLCHSSGLPAWRPLYAMASTPDEVIGVIVRVPLEERPGTSVTYSCLDFILLGLILERLSAESLSAAFDRRILQPLGLSAELGFRPDTNRYQIAGGAVVPAAEHVMTADHGFDPARVPATDPGAPDDGNARFLGGVAGNAGLFGTARGVLTLATEYLPGGGRLLGPDDVAAANGVVARGGEGHVRVLGWQVASTSGSSAGPALSPSSIGHTGFTGTSVWVDPERRMTLVLLTNRHHPSHHTFDLHPLRRRFHVLAVREGMRV
jgi:CubicO group peptidase (beta-lactamase class C family)